MMYIKILFNFLITFSIFTIRPSVQGNNILHSDTGTLKTYSDSLLNRKIDSCSKWEDSSVCFTKDTINCLTGTGEPKKCSDAYKFITKNTSKCHEGIIVDKMPFSGSDTLAIQYCNIDDILTQIKDIVKSIHNLEEIKKKLEPFNHKADELIKKLADLHTKISNKYHPDVIKNMETEANAFAASLKNIKNYIINYDSLDNVKQHNLMTSLHKLIDKIEAKLLEMDNALNSALINNNSVIDLANQNSSLVKNPDRFVDEIKLYKEFVTLSDKIVEGIKKVKSTYEKQFLIKTIFSNNIAKLIDDLTKHYESITKKFYNNDFNNKTSKYKDEVNKLAELFKNLIHIQANINNTNTSTRTCLYDFSVIKHKYALISTKITGEKERQKQLEKERALEERRKLEEAKRLEEEETTKAEEVVNEEQVAEEEVTPQEEEAAEEEEAATVEETPEGEQTTKVEATTEEEAELPPTGVHTTEHTDEGVEEKLDKDEDEHEVEVEDVHEDEDEDEDEEDEELGLEEEDLDDEELADVDEEVEELGLEDEELEEDTDLDGTHVAHQIVDLDNDVEEPLDEEDEVEEALVKNTQDTELLHEAGHHHGEKHHTVDLDTAVQKAVDETVEEEGDELDVEDHNTEEEELETHQPHVIHEAHETLADDTEEHEGYDAFNYNHDYGTEDYELHGDGHDYYNTYNDGEEDVYNHYDTGYYVDDDDTFNYNHDYGIEDYELHGDGHEDHYDTLHGHDGEDTNEYEDTEGHDEIGEDEHYTDELQTHDNHNDEHDTDYEDNVPNVENVENEHNTEELHTPVVHNVEHTTTHEEPLPNVENVVETPKNVEKPQLKILKQPRVKTFEGIIKEHLPFNSNQNINDNHQSLETRDANVDNKNEVELNSQEPVKQTNLKHEEPLEEELDTSDILKEAGVSTGGGSLLESILIPTILFLFLIVGSYFGFYGKGFHKKTEQVYDCEDAIVYGDEHQGKFGESDGLMILKMESDFWNEEPITDADC